MVSASVPYEVPGPSFSGGESLMESEAESSEVTLEEEPWDPQTDGFPQGEPVKMLEFSWTTWSFPARHGATPHS